MRFINKQLATVTVAVVAGALTVPAASAQTTLPTSTTQATAETSVCPSVQLIMVNDVSDSAAGMAQDAGFLNQVATPVMQAANEGQSPVDPSAGFSAEPTTAPALESDNSWKPDVWGQAETDQSASTPVDNASWKPDVWGESEAEPTTQTAPSSAWGESEAASTTATSDPEGDAAEVGRTVIQVRSTSDQRAYIPGVTGPETVPDYGESITEAVDQTNDVLGQINAQCPSTKVALLGVGEGAQAVSIVSKAIGRGENFPSEKVIGVTMFADPSRPDNQPVVASGDAAPAGATSQDWGVSTAEGAGVVSVAEQDEGASTGDYGEVADRTVSWCMEGDTSCAIKEGTPLRSLVANTTAGTQEQSPEIALDHIATVLVPAVALGGVETLAEDVQFGPEGFTFSRAQSADETLIGRVATNTEREIPQGEMEERLLASGMKIGGMALAAGITIGKEVVQPENLGQIAAASAVSPAAGAGAALLIAGGAALELVTPMTATTGAVRLADEAQAAGVDDQGMAEAAIQLAVGQEVSKSTGTYSTQPATNSGDSASEATTDWLLDIVGQELGRSLTTEDSPTATAPATFNPTLVGAAAQQIRSA